MLFDWNWPLFLPGAIFLIAAIDDLRSKKIHNKLILILLPLTLLAVFALKGLDGLRDGVLTALLAFIIGFPLAVARIIGGGDFKLLILSAWTLNWLDFLQILVYSLPCALFLGLAKIILDKNLKNFLFNLLFLMRRWRGKGLQFHSIPFSMALFAGWLCFLTASGLALPSGSWLLLK